MNRVVIRNKIRAEGELSFSRSSGPGGQNVNKVNSRATLAWPFRAAPWLPVFVRERLEKEQAHLINSEGLLVVSSQAHRTQARNIEDCLDKVTDLVLLMSIRPKIRKATKPNKGSIRRRLQDKKSQGEKKAGRRKPDY